MAEQSGGTNATTASGDSEGIDLPRSPFLDLEGAVEGEGPDAGMPAHYGGFVGEQRPLAAAGGDTPAIVDQGHLAVLRVEGSDRRSWLDSMTSQSLAEMQPRESAETLLLDANGRLEHAVAVFEDGVSLWLITEGSHAASLASWLNRMRFMLDVRVVPEHESYGVVATLGGAPGDASRAPDLGAASPNGVPIVWRDPWAAPPLGGVTYASADPYPGDAWRLDLHVLERPALAELARRAGAGAWPLAGNDALEALRIAAWRPRLGRDVDARTIPHELDWVRSAVHLTKGCYRGQETVAKVHNLGHPPRRIVALDLDGVTPEPGAALHVAGDESRKMVG
ncbi:MAG: CAF17-like 4Fe-4S cluster assembly/insertion protein YgfZ, partial [Pseudoclavibacter sp.]